MGIVLSDTHDSTESCLQMVLTHGLHKNKHCPCSLPSIQCTRHGERMSPRSFSLQGINILQINFVSQFDTYPNDTAFQITIIFTRNNNVNEHWGDRG